MKNDSRRFIGLSQPFINSRFGYFNSTITSDERIKSNLKHLLLTNKSERIGHPNFGCDIYRTLFENIDNVDYPFEILRERILSQIKYWMRYINVQEVSILVDEDDEHVINIRVQYINVYGKQEDSLDINIVVE